MFSNGPRSKNHTAKRWSLTTLEPRLMLAGDVQAEVAPSTPDAVEGADSPAVDLAVVAAAKRVASVVFIDSSVEDFETLAVAVASDSEIVLIDGGSDGIRQITQHLGRRQDVAAVHLVTHGKEGAIHLGQQELSADNIGRYAAQLRAWRTALSSHADILLYGCETGKGSRGADLMQAISHLTGADVAASDNVTGNQSIGADWELERAIGTIDASVAFSNDNAAGFSSHLAVDTTDDGLGTITAQGENAPNETRLEAFDNDLNTKWLDFANADPSTRASSIQYQYAGGQRFVLSSYTISSANDAPARDPRDWTLSGSNDGVVFVPVDTRAGEFFNSRLETRQFAVTGDVAYNIYRLDIGSVADPALANSVQISEIELIGVAEDPTGTPIASLVATDSSAAEGSPADPGRFTIVRSGDGSGNLDINYAISGSAGSGDYVQTLTGTVTIADQDSSVTIDITPIDDQQQEGNESLVLTLQSGANYLIGTANSDTITIIDNDTPFNTTDDGMGTITAQGENAPNETRLEAFDNDLNTKWLDFANADPSTRASSIQYQYAGGQRFVLSSYTISSANDTPARDPRDWTLSGSNDGVVFVPVDTRSAESFNSRLETRPFAVTGGAAYNLYRLDISSVADPDLANSVQISEIELIGVAEDPTGTPTVSLVATDSSAAEGSPADPGRFTIVRSGDGSGNLDINYAISGSAGSGDYVETLTGTVTIADQDSSVTIDITPIDDQQQEGNESLVLTLQSGANYLIGTANSDTITIIDNDTPFNTTDDGLGTITAQGENAPNETRLEAFDNDLNTKWLDFANADPSTRGSSIQYQYAGGQRFVLSSYTISSANDTPARDPRDWTLSGSNDGVVFVPVDTRSAEFFNSRLETRQFAVTGDVAYNIYRLDIGSVADPALANSVQISEIELIGVAEDPTGTPTVSLVATDSSAAEGSPADPGRFTIVRSGDGSGNLDINYAISGSAGSGDYVETLTGTVTIADQDSSVTIDITPIDDQQQEGNESLVLTLQSGANYLIGTANSDTITIIDNDTPFNTTDDGMGTITAQGENAPNETRLEAFDNDLNTKWLDFANADPSTRGSSIQYQYAGGQRFVLSSYTISSANDTPARDPRDWTLSGSNDGVVFVPVDTRSAEFFNSRLETRQFAVTGGTAYNIYRLDIGSVADPALANSVQISEIELIGVSENPNSGSNIIVFAAGSENEETMELWIDGARVQTWANIGGNASTGEFAIYQYTAESLATPEQVQVHLVNARFDPGQGIDDNLRIDRITIDGVSYETEAPNVYSTGTEQAGEVTPGFKESEWLNVDGFFEYGNARDPGVIGLATNAFTVDEDAGNVLVQVVRTVGSDGQITVDYDTEIGTALPGSDYTPIVGTLTFAEGETEKTIVIPILDDSVEEPIEQFGVSIDNVLGGAVLLVPRTATVTIVDDEVVLPDYPDFSSIAGLTLNGDATVSANSLRLTGTADFEGGSAFYDQAIDLSGDASFRSAFSFQISGGNGSGGADGLAFVIHNDASGATALGSPGAFLGYEGISDSVAVEFDTYQNSWDVNNNHVSIIDGSVTNPLRTLIPSFDLNNGSQYYAWVEYNGASDVLAVYLSDTATKPTLALLKTTVDLESKVGDAAWFGFSAATGGGLSNVHSILNWQLDQQVPPQDPPTEQGDTLIGVDIVSSGLDQPTAIDWLPDGTMLIAEKGGVVKTFSAGALSSTPFIDISGIVNGVRDRGLLDIAVHPDFEDHPYVYLLFTYDPPEVFSYSGLAGPDGKGNRAGRLIRVTADASNNYLTAIADSQEVLLGKNSTWNNFNAFANSTNDFDEPPAGELADGSYVQDFIPSDSESHTVGGLAFAPDGALYVSIGDGASYNDVDVRADRVQDEDSLSGKILRIDPLNGEGLPDNPFVDPNDPDPDLTVNSSKVYQLGLRNPFRISVDPMTGKLFIGDVGWVKWEEINSAGPKANFGWPFYEGGNGVSLINVGYQNTAEGQDFFDDNVPVDAAIYALNHQADGINAIVMGDVYRGSQYGPEYEGDVFFNDLGQGIVRHASIDASGNVTDVNIFTTGANVVVAISQGPDGALYYVDLDDQQVGRWEIV